MAGNKAISQLPVAGALDGTELVELVQAGDNVQSTAQDIADLAGGGIAGSGTLDYLPKFTPNGTTLGNSWAYNEDALFSIVRNDGTQPLQLNFGLVNNTSGFNFTSQADSAGVTTSQLFVQDVDNVAGVTLLPSEVSIYVEDNASNVLTRIALSTTGLSFFGELFGYSCSTYPDKLIDIEGSTGVIRLGDVAANVNGTYMIIDDTDQEIEFSNNLRVNGGSYSPSGNFLKVTVSGTPQLIELLTP